MKHTHTHTHTHKHTLPPAQHGNDQKWVVKAELDTNNNADIDFRVPGKSSPPPVSLRATFWHLERPHGETRIAVAFSDPSSTIAPSFKVLNMWLSDPMRSTDNIKPLQNSGILPVHYKLVFSDMHGDQKSIVRHGSELTITPVRH